MGVVSSDLTKGLVAGVKTLFMKELYDTPTIWQLVATLVKSTKAVEDYSWLGQVAMAREWVDERVPRGVMEQTFSVTNRDFESTIEMHKNALDDEQYGQLQIRVRDLARRMKQFIDKTVIQKFSTGDSETCYDGQYFFDVDHADPKATYTTSQANEGTLALDATNLGTTITAMRKFKDDRGEVIGVNPNTLLVPPDLEWTALTVLESALKPGVTNNDKNVMQGRLKLIVSHWLTDANRWYVLDTTGVVKPLIWQLRDGPNLTHYIPKGQDETRESFMRKRLFFGADLRGEVAFADWRFAYSQNPS